MSGRDDAAASACRAVLDAALKLADQGFLAGVGGNLALRIDERRMAVTPSATDYYTMTAEDVCVVELRSLRVLAGTRTPSVESGLHAKVLLRRPDCRASVHTHQPIASAFTLLGLPLPVVAAAQRACVGDDVPVAGYAPSGTGWLARNVARLVQPQRNAYLMRNHGVVCLGATLDDARAVVLAVEQAASDWFERHGTRAPLPERASRA
jgi:L-fuculose-phosphate aldolase